MRVLLCAMLILGLTACGAETATTAVTVAELKAKEAQEGEKKMDRMQSDLNEAMQKAEQRPRSLD